VAVEGEAGFFAAVIHLVAVIVEATEAEGEGMHHTRKSCCNTRRSIALFRDPLLSPVYTQNVSLGYGIKGFFLVSC